MPFMPFNILAVWFRGILSIAIIAAGVFFLARWYDESHVIVRVRPNNVERAPSPTNEDDRRGGSIGESAQRVFRFDPGLNRETAYLAGGLALLVWAFAGALIRGALSPLLGGPKLAQDSSEDEPRSERTGEIHTIQRPGGRELRIECYGPPDAPPLVLTHGWGCSSTEWFYAKKHLAGPFRVIVWDEPGLGLSPKPADNDYRLEALAGDLEAVMRFAGGQPAVLVGHSIGGMIILTLCGAFPESLKSVAGLVLVHTTYTNPVRTTKLAGFYTAIEKPILIPLLYATIALWPLVWVLNWLSYLRGSAHRSTHKQSFAGTETRGQLDFFAAQMPHARPDVLARGMLGMLRYDAQATLSQIGVPTLVIVGDQDTTTLPEAGQHIARSIPGAQLSSLTPARHLGLIEHHGEFDAQVRHFAESCLARSSSHSR